MNIYEYIAYCAAYYIISAETYIPSARASNNKPEHCKTDIYSKFGQLSNTIHVVPNAVRWPTQTRGTCVCVCVCGLIDVIESIEAC